MKKLLAITAIFIAFIIFSQPAQANQVAVGSAVLKNEVLGIKNPDPRAEKLEAFLINYNSPLASYAEKFVDAADSYQLDWKLVPAIAGVESTFGKKIPAGSFNAYGWNNGNYCFQSWEQSIDYVSQYLRKNYLDRGLDTPYKIGPIYAPPSPAWGAKVAYFIKQIECFGQENCLGALSLTI